MGGIVSRPYDYEAYRSIAHYIEKTESASHAKVNCAGFLTCRACIISSGAARFYDKTNRVSRLPTINSRVTGKTDKSDNPPGYA